MRLGLRPEHHTSAAVRDAVRARIERGSLLPGDRLPTVRSLAEANDLAPNTVARAYRELHAEGWIEGRGRAGTFVTAVLPRQPSDAERALAEAADDFARRAEQLGFSVEDAVRALRR